MECHSSLAKDRIDPDINLQSWFKTDNIEEASKLVNRAKEENIDKLVAWIYHSLAYENTQFNFEISTGGIVCGFMKNIKKNKISSCYAIHVSLRTERLDDEGTRDVYFVNAFPVVNCNPDKCGLRIL